jgi:outer membrane protein TolC
VAGVTLGPDARPADELQQLGVSPPTAADGKPVDPTLQTLQERRSAATATARVHDHAFTPVLSANAQAGVQGQSGSVFPLYRVVVNMTVPLWDGGADRANRSQAQAQAAQLAAQAEDYRSQREHVARRSARSRQNVLQRIATAEELVRLCGLRLSQLEEGRPLGAATAPDVAAARATLQRAETELVLAQAAQAQLVLGLE